MMLALGSAGISMTSSRLSPNITPVRFADESEPGPWTMRWLVHHTPARGRLALALRLIPVLAVAAYSAADHFALENGTKLATFMLGTVCYGLNQVVSYFRAQFEQEAKERLQYVSDELSEVRAELAACSDRSNSYREQLSAHAREFVEGWAYMAARRACRNHAERVSLRVTVYLMRDDTFTRVARYSDNQSNKNSAGRATYDRNYGLLGEAWKNVRSSCSLKPFDTADPDPYIHDQCHSGGIHRRDALYLGMKSCRYEGFRIDVHDREPIGVVMFESTMADALQQGDRIMSDEERGHLAEMLNSLFDYLPNVDSAEERGF